MEIEVSKDVFAKLAEEAGSSWTLLGSSPVGDTRRRLTHSDGVIFIEKNSELEARYAVFKIKDATEALSPEERISLAVMLAKVSMYRAENGKHTLDDSIVIEEDWPEHAATLALLKARINGDVLAHSVVKAVQNTGDVHSHLFNFLEDPTDDSGFFLVRSILTAFGNLPDGQA